MTRWPRYYLAFLIGLGVSNIGNWLYLIALNVFVWRLTESPAAVAGIYIVGPVIRIISNVVAGSLIDRMNKKKLVILVDVSRALFIFPHAICVGVMDDLSTHCLYKYCGDFFWSE